MPRLARLRLGSQSPFTVPFTRPAAQHRKSRTTSLSSLLWYQPARPQSVLAGFLQPLTHQTRLRWTPTCRSRAELRP
ncbi:hypothetical protein C8034_v003010 [Colletotrichum sidae]|uniref:Uncharacterized protein n=1 Tax=Colletotrichum sidae TaxID=1347389 RepID=A0A4R8TBB1_9PEZI|nr:hypothetical protein C8034_v003010 [Colletotrichum sidae]